MEGQAEKGCGIGHWDVMNRRLATRWTVRVDGQGDKRWLITSLATVVAVMMCTPNARLESVWNENEPTIEFVVLVCAMEGAQRMAQEVAKA